MKKILGIFLSLFISTMTLSQPEFFKVKFDVYVSGVNDSEPVFIAGNDSLLGYWNPSNIRLNRISDSLWSKSFLFEANESLEYKFTKGSWDFEALNDDGSIPGNSVLKVTKDTIITVYIKKWKTGEPRAYHGQITGTVKYHYNFEGEGLKPRDIIVWLPTSYYANPEKRYPVLYVHDGQNIFDPSTSTFGFDWRLDEVTDSLIKSGTINEIIIVGIYNTSDRSLEYRYSSLGYQYMDFIISKVKPFIDSTYRTLPDAQNTAVGGSSAGGLISFIMAWRYPEIFSKAACLSPALKIQKLNYVDTVINYTGSKKHNQFYIDNGGVGVETNLQPGIDEMIITLKNKGYELGKDIVWYIDPNAIHSETSWAQRVWRPLIFFFGKKN